MLAGSPADFGKLIADETEKWGKVIQAAASRRSDRRDHGQIFRNARSAHDHALPFVIIAACASSARAPTPSRVRS